MQARRETVMKRRTFVKNLAAAIAIPGARVLAPAVCEPIMPKGDVMAHMDVALQQYCVDWTVSPLVGLPAALEIPDA